MSNQGDQELNILIRFKADLDRAIVDSKKGMGQISDDAKKGGDALGIASKAGGGLLSVMKSLAGPVLAFFTAQGIASFVRNMAGAFMQGEASAMRLSSVLQIAKGDFNALQPLIKSVSKELSAYGFTNDEVNKSLADMALRNYSFAQSLDIVRAAAKLAVVQDMTLAEATNEIARAALGVVRPGTALGAILGDVREQLEKSGDKGKNLALVLGRLEQLGPAAAAQMGTLKGALKSLGAEWDELLETLGSSAFGNWLADFVKNTAGGLKAIRDELGLLKRTADEALKDELIEKISNLQGRLKRASEGKSMGNPSSLGAPGMPGIAFARFEDPTKLQNELDAAFAQMKDVQDRLTKKSADDKAKADKAASDQDAALAKQEAENRIKLNREFVEKDSFARAQSEADILENLSAKAAADRQQRFQDEIKSTLATGESKAAIIRGFYAKEAELAQQSATIVARIRADATQNESERIAKEVGTVDAAMIKDVATGGATVPSSMDGWLGTLPKDKKNLEEIVGWMNKLAESIRKADEAADDAKRAVSRFPQQQKEGVGAAFSAVVTQRSQDIQRIGTDLAQRVAIVETQRNVGNIRDREAQRQILEAQAGAARDYTVELRDLLELRQQVAQAPDITDASRVELMRDLNDQVAILNSKITELTPSLEAVARNSDNVWIGMQLGAQRVTDKIKSFAQLTADAMEIIADNLGTGFYNAFEGIINGTKSAANAFREMTISILQDMARMFAQQAAMQLIGGLIGGALGSLGSAGSSAAMSSFKTTGSVGFKVGQGYAEGGVIPGPVTADDRYPVMVRGGEGFIRPEAVSWIGGPRAIHAINRMMVPQDIISKMLASLPSAPSIPSFHFAAGGVAASLSSASGGGGAVPVVIQNNVAIGDAEIARIAASSETRKGVMATIAANPRQVRQILGLS